MRQYKGRTPQQELRDILAGLMFLGRSLHGGCAERIAGLPFSHWCAVPSLPAKPGEHPFRRLASYAASGAEVSLTAAATAPYPRSLNIDHFRADALLPRTSHVLLMDDTWVGGGHIQSAALALRKAGANKISVMAAARWINPAYGNNQAFIKEHLTSDFNPRICPWTGGACPGP